MISPKNNFSIIPINNNSKIYYTENNHDSLNNIKMIHLNLKNISYNNQQIKEQNENENIQIYNNSPINSSINSKKSLNTENKQISKINSLKTNMSLNDEDTIESNHYNNNNNIIVKEINFSTIMSDKQIYFNKDFENESIPSTNPSARNNIIQNINILKSEKKENEDLKEYENKKIKNLNLNNSNNNLSNNKISSNTLSIINSDPNLTFEENNLKSDDEDDSLIEDFKLSSNRTLENILTSSSRLTYSHSSQKNFNFINRIQFTKFQKKIHEESQEDSIFSNKNINSSRNLGKLRDMSVSEESSNSFIKKGNLKNVINNNINDEDEKIEKNKINFINIQLNDDDTNENEDFDFKISNSQNDNFIQEKNSEGKNEEEKKSNEEEKSNHENNINNNISMNNFNEDNLNINNNEKEKEKNNNYLNKSYENETRILPISDFYELKKSKIKNSEIIYQKNKNKKSYYMSRKNNRSENINFNDELSGEEIEIEENSLEILENSKLKNKIPKLLKIKKYIKKIKHNLLNQSEEKEIIVNENFNYLKEKKILLNIIN